MEQPDPATEGPGEPCGDSESRDTGASASLDAVGARVGELVARFEQHPLVAVRDDVFELLQGIDALHRTGMTRLVELLVEARGEEVLAELAADPIAGPVLELYDLVPPDERTQAEDALDTVRPYIHSHGGEVEVLDVQGGIVHVRLVGSCHGCSGSAMTLRRGVEEALRTGFPGFKELAVHESAPSPVGGLITVESLKDSAQRLRRPQWAEVASIGDLPSGTVKGYEVSGTPVLLCSVDGEVYGFRDECPECGMPLHEGKLSGVVLVCPWQNCAYDARTGRRVDRDGGERLVVFPVATNDGLVQLALNVPGAAPTGSA